MQQNFFKVIKLRYLPEEASEVSFDVYKERHPDMYQDPAFADKSLADLISDKIQCNYSQIQQLIENGIGNFQVDNVRIDFNVFMPYITSTVLQRVGPLVKNLDVEKI